MQRSKVKIGELNFEFIDREDEATFPVLEIENDASMVFEKVELQKAVELRELLDQFIKAYDFHSSDPSSRFENP